MRRYDRTVVVRAREDEHRAWSVAAERAGVKISEWIREACARLLKSESEKKSDD